MNLVYTSQALESLNEVLEFLKRQGVSQPKRVQIRNQILEKARELLKNPEMGQREDLLSHLQLNHRRIHKGHCKIIYRVIGETIYITDIFDSRQDPSKMKG